MVEFALILPILALLTFGTLEVAIYLQQQSTINAAAFIGARSASVLGNSKAESEKSLRDFTTATGFDWLTSATVKTDLRGDSSSFTLTAGAGRVSGLLNALSDGQITSLDTLSGSATLPLEYTAKKISGSYKSTSKPMTHFMVNYYSQPVKLPPVMTDGGGRGLTLLRSAFQKVPKNIPGLEALNLDSFNVLAPGNEPFAIHAAVVNNPKARNDAGGGDTGQFKSSAYLQPNMEESAMAQPKFDGPKPAYNILNLHQRFDGFEDALYRKKGTIRETCITLGKVPLPAEPISAAAITAVRNAAGGVGKGLESGANAGYKTLETVETGLFR